MGYETRGNVSILGKDWNNAVEKRLNVTTHMYNGPHQSNLKVIIEPTVNLS